MIYGFLSHIQRRPRNDYCSIFKDIRFVAVFLASEAGYRDWRAAKLARYPARFDELLVNIGRITSINSHEHAAITTNIQRANMAVYTCRDDLTDRAAIVDFGAKFGLINVDHHQCADDEGVAELTVASGGQRSGYVPYSSRSLSWHTDGYYNAATNRVRAVILHCVQDSAEGGRTAVLDPEIAYIRLRDESPAFIKAFEHPECMSIPANVVDGVEIRAAVSGPVFSYDVPGGALHMRYSARKKNIQWRDDAITESAREFFTDLLGSKDGPVLQFRLAPGQGLISNNVLHNRTSFEDTTSKKRRLFRARFFDRINSS
jgi:hypothetical protein